MKPLSFFFLVSLIFFSSCKKEDNTPRTIHPDFQEYVDRFYEEAEKRGRDLSRKNLEVVYEDLSIFGFCGFGTFSNNNIPAPSVQIDLSSECWEDKNDFARENLIFHELGHAVLERIHLNDLLPNGSPRSMMCGDGACNNFRVYSAYTLATRDYYLNELFSIQSPLPKWASLKRNTRTYYKEAFNSLPTKQKIWSPYVSNTNLANLFVSNILDSIPISLSNGLSIEAKNKKANATAGWQLFINKPIIREGARIDVTVEALTKQLSGTGVVLIVRVMSGDAEEVVLASDASDAIRGSNENYETLTATIGYYPKDVQRIEVYLLVQVNTVGTAYFDNFELMIGE